ncbi:hypothetical protein [Rufibacter latericius]|nr:hypothetical protein [Rufibacter latericius]
MVNYAKEQVSKEVLEIILDHYTPKLTSKECNLFGISIIYYFPQEDQIENDCNPVAFIVRENAVDSCYILASQVSDAHR